MFESCRAHFRLRAADDECPVLGHLGAHVAERAAGNRTRDPADDLVVPDDLVAHLSRLDIELSQAAVDVTSMSEARDRFLPRKAALRE